MLTAFDKRNLQLLRQDLQAAVATVSQKHGIQVTVGNARFTSDNATFKVEIATLGENGTVNNRAASDFKQLCSMYGLQPEHLGAEVVVGGQRYTLVGLASGRSYKFPFLGKRVSDGKTYKLPESAVAKLKTQTAPVAEANHARGSAAVEAASQAPATPEERRKVEALIAEVRNDSPEMYFADGERKEAEAHRFYFNRFLREIRGGSAISARSGK